MASIKLAQGEAPQGDDQFERSFSDLAYANLREKAPKLLDYLVGFQVIDKNDKDTRAAGVFGFKVGKQWFMAPIFFMNGELRGTELLYIKDQDSFVPLQENWVNYLIGRKPIMLGESTPLDERQLGIHNPNYRAYIDSPLRGWHKTSSAEYDGTDNRYGYWRLGASFDVSPMIDCVLRSVNEGKYKEACDRMSLSKALPELGEKAAAVLMSSIDKNPSLGSAIGKFYDACEIFPELRKASSAITPIAESEIANIGMDKQLFMYYVEKLARSSGIPKGSDKAVIGVLSRHGIKTASQLKENKDKLSFVIDKAAAQAAKINAKALVADKDEVLSNPPKDLTDAEREELNEEGLLIRDTRDDSEKSKAFDVDLTSVLSNPEDSGVYEMISKDGKSYEVLVLRGPKTIGEGYADVDLIIRTDGSGFGVYAPKSTIVRKHKISDWRPFYDKLKSVEDMKVGNTYVAVGPGAEGTLVFTVVEKDGDDIMAHVESDYINSCHDDYLQTQATRYVEKNKPYRPGIAHNYSTTSLRKDDARGSESKDDKMRWKSNSVRHVFLTDRIGHLKAMGDTLMVPKTYRVMELKGDLDKLGFTPGNFSDAELVMFKRASLSTVKLWSDGICFQVEDKSLSSRMDLRDTANYIVNNIGLSKEATLSIIDRAKREGRTTFAVKQALSNLPSGGRLTPGPSGPQPAVLDNNNTAGYNPAIKALEEYSQETFRPANLPVGSYGDYDPYAPTLPKIDEAAMGAATTAARSGQKEILDTAVLGGLVKAMNIDQDIDKYLSDLMVGEDRLGRLLFMFYWHNDKFSDRYGDADMKELEDALTNTFKSNGDLILFLKKKSIEPDISQQGSDVDLDSLA
jgi:hypothetical protein